MGDYITISIYIIVHIRSYKYSYWFYKTTYKWGASPRRGLPIIPHLFLITSRYSNSPGLVVFTALCKTFTCHRLNHGVKWQTWGSQNVVDPKMGDANDPIYSGEIWGNEVWNHPKYFDLGIRTNVCEGGLVATCCAKCADTDYGIIGVMVPAKGM